MNSNVRVLIDKMSLSEGWGLCLVRTDFIMVLVDEMLLLLRVLDCKQTHVTPGSPFCFVFSLWGILLAVLNHCLRLWQQGRSSGQGSVL